jgi:hypothetical protein
LAENQAGAIHIPRSKGALFVRAEYQLFKNFEALSGPQGDASYRKNNEIYVS